MAKTITMKKKLRAEVEMRVPSWIGREIRMVREMERQVKKGGGRLSIIVPSACTLWWDFRDR